VDLDETADLCEGDVIFLDAVLQGSYTWSDGSTNQILQVSSGGTYSVTVTDNFGCITADTTVVTEVPNAVADWDTASVSFFTVTFANASTGATTYAWDFGDGSTSTDENPTHIYSNTWYDTCYTVTLTVTGDCGTDTYMDTVCVGEVLSVEDGVRNEDQISMYPNPTEGIVNVVVATSGKELSIEVVDIQGRQIFARDYGQASSLVKNELDLSGVAKGVYMVKVTLDDQTTVERVTVR
jgi:PKD repeat protein